MRVAWGVFVEGKVGGNGVGGTGDAIGDVAWLVVGGCVGEVGDVACRTLNWGASSVSLQV